MLSEKQLAFHITTCCTLNCRLCVNMMPIFKKRGIAKHIPLQQIKDEIDAVFQIYDFIEDVTISGGEPLLHPNLSEIIEHCMEYKKQFNVLRVFSNGTIIPQQELIDQIRQYNGRLQFVVDDYGPQNSTKVGDIDLLFKNCNLPLRVNCYWGDNQHCGGWVDYGSPEVSRNYSSKDLVAMYKNCHVAQYKCIGVFNRKMVNCCWAIFGRELGFMPFSMEGQNQLLDILDSQTTLEEKKKIASAFGTQPLWACQYCNGFDSKQSKRFSAGIQEG